MSRTNQLCSLPEIISFLKNRNFDKFRFADAYAYIYNSDGSEIVLEAVSDSCGEIQCSYFYAWGICN